MSISSISGLTALTSASNSDLSSGDLAGARTAVGTFLTALKSEGASGANGHHHHHHTDENQSTSLNDSTFSAGTSESSDTDVASDYLATLLKAVQADQGTASTANPSSGLAS